MYFYKSECKLERFESLEFHYNELIKKHKLSLECIKTQKKDFDILKTDFDLIKVNFLRLTFPESNFLIMSKCLRLN